MNMIRKWFSFGFRKIDDYIWLEIKPNFWFRLLGGNISLSLDDIHGVLRDFEEKQEGEKLGG